MTSKRCPSCKKTKPLSEFHGPPDKSRPCKVCRNGYRTAHRSKVRNQIRALKLEAGCVDCGYAEHADALHFDHLPGVEKCFPIARAWSYSADRVAREIEKCVVRCANCHAIKTAERREAAMRGR